MSSAGDSIARFVNVGEMRAVYIRADSSFIITKVETATWNTVEQPVAQYLILS